MKASRFDIAIVGGGMVGAAAACLLARCGFSVAVIEAHAPRPPEPDADYDLRVSALSPGSRAILEAAGAWAAVTEHRHRPYRRMQVEDPGAGRTLTFDAPAFGLECLGYIVENAVVQSALWRQMEVQARIEMLCPDRLQALDEEPGQLGLTLESGARLTACLVVGADGPGSLVRSLAGIGQDLWEYNQAGLVCVVRKQHGNPGVAWQRFLAGGPLAFLPLGDGRSSIVWTRPADEADRLLELDDDGFVAELQAASDGWLGEVRSVGPRASFPLAMRLSERHVAGRVLLLGDAAHVVHPLAGQGVNLGFADAAALAETLAGLRAAGEDLAEPSALRAYERWRRSESGLMSLGIHGLGGLFGSAALGGLRGLGLAVVSRSWFLQEAFVRRAAGLNRQAPRLARGEPLECLADSL